ncbi:N-acyl-phosphatidylethanolamine-hydrolyzing phospholipase D-like [Littorina saxatilis]|uniref:N-acetylphosphatidylethanolamine-hydrolyzing phospholipase D n=1 Tax=Littorina saxatilis TaxID=31220 RepID=A0AAN9BCK5_9CAEN
MRQPKTVALLSAALTSVVVVTYNQYFKPLPGDRPQDTMAASPNAREANSVAVKTAVAPSSEAEFTKPIFENGRFKNPWETWEKPRFTGIMKMLFTVKNESEVPSKEELDRTLPIIKPDISEFNNPLQSGVRMMWIGHATVVAQLDGFTVITDPIFSQRSAPVQWVGPKRYRDPPCTVEELPKLDAVLISHNHYDHLDHGTVVALNKRFGKDLRWFVPMGLKSWMREVGCENVVEMTWWDEQEVEGTGGVRVASTPCQHWCKRGARDDNKVLWTSWCVVGPKDSFYFAGDTGYCRGFEQIGRKYGPFTAAAIPIGAYHPRWFMGPQHVDPAQALDVHTDIKAKHSIGIHWGTFVLTYEHYLQPQELLRSEVEKRQLSPDSFVTVSHGAITTFGADNYDTVD